MIIVGTHTLVSERSKLFRPLSFDFWAYPILASLQIILFLTVSYGIQKLLYLIDDEKEIDFLNLIFYSVEFNICLS